MNILTFDIEEWFHILDYHPTKEVSTWDSLEPRIDGMMDLIFQFLSDRNLQATFFVVGWIADRYPHIVKRIAYNGYELGSHTQTHTLLYEHDRNRVKEELNKSISTLEMLSGDKVSCFRAPGFSITEKNNWIFEELYNHGIRTDSSIFPTGRAHGGYSNFNVSAPCIVEFDGLRLKEFPINTLNVCGKKIVYTGGGYFRITPYVLVKYFSNRSDYIMSYFHPRDFDVNQPKLNDLGFIRNFKTYVGINRCLEKLGQWVEDFRFVDIRTADKLIEWDNVQVVSLKSK